MLYIVEVNLVDPMIREQPGKITHLPRLIDKK